MLNDNNDNLENLYRVPILVLVAKMTYNQHAFYGSWARTA